MPDLANLAAIRAQIAAVEAGTRTPSKAWRFGIEAVDGCFRGGGLPRGTWHEVVAEGMEAELCAAPAAFTAQIMRALSAEAGEIVWIMRRDDLYPPGLSGLGVAAERLIQVRAESEEEVLAVVEEALSTRGVAAVVGEAEEVPLVAGRRLQLACERGGATGFVLARRPWGVASRKGRTEGSAAASRWKVSPAPGTAGSGGMGLGMSRWNVELARCRGGRSGAWIFEEAGHGAHPFRLASPLADHGLAQEPGRIRRIA